MIAKRATESSGYRPSTATLLGRCEIPVAQMNENRKMRQHQNQLLTIVIQHQQKLSAVLEMMSIIELPQLQLHE
jgi:hypothetical protein